MVLWYRSEEYPACDQINTPVVLSLSTARSFFCRCIEYTGGALLLGALVIKIPKYIVLLQIFAGSSDTVCRA